MAEWDRQAGDSINAPLRQPLAKALADYVGDTHEVLGGGSETYSGHQVYGPVWKDGDTVRMAVGEDNLVRFMRGLSEDPAAYGALHRAATGRIDQDFAGMGADAAPEERKDLMGRGGAVLGVFDAIRADVEMDHRDDANAQADWKAKALYHIVGAPITAVPLVGDGAQRLLDTWTYEVSLGEKDRNNSAAIAAIADNRLAASEQMSNMIGIWARERGIGADTHAINALQRDAQSDLNTNRTKADTYLGRGNA